MKNNLIDEVSRIKEIMSYKTIINENKLVKNDNILSEAGIVDIARRLASYASKDLLDEISTVLKKSISKIDDLSSDDIIKVLGKKGTHINSFNQLIYKEIEKDFAWLGKKEALNMTSRDLSKKFYDLGYEPKISGKYKKWLEEKKQYKFKDTKSPTPKPQPSPAPAPAPAPAPSSSTTIPPGGFTSEADAWNWFETEFKKKNVYKKLGPKQGQVFVLQAKEEITKALESVKGQKSIVDLANMKSAYDQLPPLTQQKILKEVQQQIRESGMGKTFGSKVAEILGGGILNLLRSTGSAIGGLDLKKKSGLIILSTAASIILDILQAIEAGENDTEFKNHFGLNFTGVMAGKTTIALLSGYLKKTTPLLMVNIFLALDSVFNYFWYRSERTKKGGETEWSDYGRRLTIKDAKSFVESSSNPIGLDSGDKVTSYELVDSKGVPMNNQKGDGRYVNVYVNGNYYTKIEQNYLGTTKEVK